MTDLFCTLGFSSNATDEERAEQSDERIGAATELARRIDKTKKIPLEQVLDKLIAHFEYEKITPTNERDSLQNYELENFVEKALQASIREQQMAELKTKILFLMYKEINYCFDADKRTVEKNFPNHTKKTIEKAIAQGYFALDVVRSGRSINEVFTLKEDIIFELSKLNDHRAYEAYEEIIRQNKISPKVLKKMIEYIKNGEKISLQAAYEKAKEEFQRNKKLNRGDVTEIRKLKKNHKEMIKCWQHAVEERKNAEYRYEDLKKENLKTVKQNETIMENFNSFLTQIIKSDKFEFTKIFYNEFRKIESELKNIGIRLSVLENINWQSESITTNTEENCRKDFVQTTSTE